jgi:hypothetical protein
MTTQIFCISSKKWSVEIKKQQKDSTTITELAFKLDKKRLRYIPEKGSLWVLNIEETVIENNQYFLTGWSNGSRNLLFRVFDPNISTSPICEIISFSDKAKLRSFQGYLQIRITPDTNYSEKVPQKVEWKNCRKLK